MTQEELPLRALFLELREAGLPLGISEYLELLHALQGGFGMSNRDALRKLCHALWTTSPEEKRLFDSRFDKIIPLEKTRPAAEPLPAARPIAVPGGETPPTAPAVPVPDSKDQPKEMSVPGPADKPVPATATPDVVSPPILLKELESDEIQARRMVEATRTDLEPSYRRFVWTGEFLPVTRRQMRQSWRFLRRMVREGPAVELDVQALIKQVARQGFLLSPVMVPRRINRIELLFLIDRGGSMAPFHALADRLAETAESGGRLGRAGIYYFHNCPDGYFYRTTAMVEADEIKTVLGGLHADRTVALIFSDGGAARGSFNAERLRLTQAFLNDLKGHVRHVAWLNPMPGTRWRATTADSIARLVPMFDISRRGMDDAIDVLRGRHVGVIHA